MKAVLDANLHFEGVDHIREGGESVDGKVMFLHQVRETTNHQHSEEIPERDYIITGHMIYQYNIILIPLGLHELFW